MASESAQVVEWADTSCNTEPEILARLSQAAEVLRWVDHTLVETGEEACTIRLQADKLDWLVMAVVRIALHASVKVIGPRQPDVPALWSYW